MASVFEDVSIFLRSHGIMSLATVGKDGPWAATVYYGIDDDLNMYIVTGPETKHGKNVIKNPKVAFTVFDSHTGITEPKKGIQGQGICTVLKSVPEIIKGLALWHKANPGIESRITLEAVKKVADTKVWKITPTHLKFFAKEIYGSEEYGVWKSR